MSYMKDFIATREEMDRFFMLRAEDAEIITRYDPKPSHIRSCDWSAVTDDYDGDGEHPVGYGATEQEAIDDLQHLLGEQE